MIPKWKISIKIPYFDENIIFLKSFSPTYYDICGYCFGKGGGGDC